MCNECRKVGSSLHMASRNRKKACLQCTGKYIKFMQDGESVTQRTP